MKDLTWHDHGSLWVLIPETPAGEDWIENHIPEDAIAWGKGIVVEPRYVPDIMAGIAEDGLTQ